MSIVQVFYIKLILCAVFTLIGFWVVKNEQFFENNSLKNHDKKILIATFVFFRLLPFAVVYVMLGLEPRNDVPFFFYKAQHAKQGLFVYRDFWSFHAPLFSYIISVPLFIWHNARSIVFLMISVEGLIVWLTYRDYKTVASNALQKAVLYWVLPGTFVFVLLNGQEDLWFWGVTLLSWQYIKKHTDDHQVGAALLFILGLLCIKITFIFMLPPLLILAKKPFKIVAVMGLGVLSVGFLYYHVGDKFLMPIQHTATLLTPNLFSVLRPFIEIFGHIKDSQYGLANWIGLVCTVMFSSWIAYKNRHLSLRQALPLLFIITFVSMTVFQPSAPGGYAVAYLLIVLFEVIDVKNNKHLLLLFLFHVVMVVQPFVYVYNGSPSYQSFSMFSNPILIIEYLLQAVNVACYISVIVLAYHKLRFLKTIN
jgi:hypothetical protein